MPDETALVPAATGVAADALDGLLRTPKTLPAKLFYDEAGCRLFAQITELPEYYLTRTERSLLEWVAPRVAESLAAPAVLVEYGASDEAKAEFLLNLRDRGGSPIFPGYVAIDVASPSLERMRARLRRSRPYLQLYTLTADFTSAFSLPVEVPDWQRLGFFPGSTIGNLDPPEATLFLRRARRTLGEAARFLVGADLRKDASILIPAYNDAAGVTAAFNLNLLVRLNREAGADFDLDAFEHRAIWNDADSRIEMHLISRREQVVQLAGHAIHFAAGESIHTENSYKYSVDHFATLANAAGWHSVEMWTDDAGLFSLHLLEPRRWP